MMKRLSLLLASGLVFSSTSAFSQETPPVPPTPPPAGAHVWGSVVRAGSYLGVMLGELDDEDRARLNLGETSGALITEVTPGSPAEKAGLRQNDVVVGVDGTSITGPRELSRTVRQATAGQTITLEIIRDGQRMNVDAIVGERTVELPTSLGFDVDSLKDHFAILRGRMDSLRISIGDDVMKLEREFMIEHPDGAHAFAFAGGGQGRLGAQLQPLTPQLAKYFGVQGKRGALVGSVSDSGAAGIAGLQAGDVIVAVDGKEIATPGDVAKIVAKKEAGPVDVKIVRDRREKTVRVELPKKSLHAGIGANINRELRILGNGGEIRVYRDGSDIADTTIRLLDGRMLEEVRQLENLPNMPELRELEDLSNMPELRELERLPEMIREEMRRREESGDLDVDIDIEAEVEVAPETFDRLPEGSGTNEE